jgi:transcriptional regulator with XRE-family HTH domain/quercetin dioxygenase-like cupin family protein
MPDDENTGASGAATALARAVRARRGELGLTLDVLARRTGLSKGFLSQMEAGKANPTLNSLLLVANALGLPPAALFTLDTRVADAAPAGPREGGGLGGPVASALRDAAARALDAAPALATRTRASVPTTLRPARPVGAWPDGVGRTYLLSAPGARRFQVLLTDGVPTHHETDVSHEGEEFCLVLAGELAIDVDGVEHRLGAGEAVHYDSSLTHRMRVLSGPSRVLLVI